MANPVLVEVLRGDLVESRHEGSVAVFDDAGKPLLSIGDVDQPVFPRSAVKAIQALPLVESGAADHYGFGDKELALACASHSGEPEHVALAAGMLAKASLDGSALECGAHWPLNQEATIGLARAGEKPSALHNNCSGKHAGFLCGCRHLRIDHAGYIGAAHSYQETVRRTMAEVTGAEHGARNRGTDGCSIPTYAVPLRNLATGFARMATGNGLSADRASAAKHLFAACMAEPFYVSGAGRADIGLMKAAPGRIFAKTGAEGVYCAGVPELGLGIALKCDDGQGRASEVAVAAVLTRLFAHDGAVQAALADLVRPVLKNWNGIRVGGLRPAAVLL
jgi:L-asparaginase II